MLSGKRGRCPFPWGGQEGQESFHLSYLVKRVLSNIVDSSVQEIVLGTSP